MCAISSTSDARIREVQLISLANKLNSLALHLQNIVLTTTATAAVGHTDNLSVIIMANLDGPALFNLFSTGQYSDFTIICKDREFKVHKMVICPNSDFFRAIAKGSFQVKASEAVFLSSNADTSQEQDSVTLQESDPDIIAKVLHYLYFASYHTADEACLSAHHVVLREATMFDSTCEGGWFQALNCRTKSKKDVVLAQLRTHFQVYKAADMLGVEPLKRAATGMLLETVQLASSAKNLATILENIYDTLPETDTVLRPAITHSCAVNYDRLCCHTEVSALMEKFEPALWTAAGVMARVHKVRMKGFSEEVVTKICRERLCGCEGNGLVNLDVAISPGYTRINAECDR